MSNSRIALATTALACCLFAGTASAVPYFPDRDTNKYEAATQQGGGSYSAVFNQPSKYDWQLGKSDRDTFQADSNAASNSSNAGSKWSGSSASDLASAFGSNGGPSLNALYDLLRLILALLEKFDHNHNGGGTGGNGNGGTGNPEAPAQTPLPAPVLLLGSGLAVVGLVVRRRRKQAGVAA